ncbi:UDP-N-acetylmuramoyl-L-alanyl-D-glutamate--2,6-diaminopimelate ligase [Candidatus Bilamarchaeum dharawalense]|uniref:Probable bifunctional folylpolyglutamate synthase/dihydropteroate synthase n=1 Tax=Candidatus Bilamarchaeum dharawalense TaxID=2885759 RepID=A0A5E4LSU3_9ARCH|nr:UDP-N-acetylmuramoyl-L-alanyl-D-glutamate--2,6-diaminopimelate ligase [Candidatus Bilamarchaeum dharawalense]
MENGTVQYLYSLKGHGSKLGLDRMEHLLTALGNPEKSFKSVLVAGTNGKGSTVAAIYSILRQSGFVVGRYTSPHITSLNERIVVDDQQISDEQLFVIVNRIRKKIETLKDQEGFEHPTFFELTTAAAFLYFKEMKIDFAVLEVGMGGRRDATNTVTPLISVVTNVSLEHTKILGDTIEKIAWEKGGIIKNNGILITAAEGSALTTLEKISKEKKSGIFVVGMDITYKSRQQTMTSQKFSADVFGKQMDLELNLLGEHQIKNALCALGTVSIMQQTGIQIPETAIRMGLKKINWPGRMEIIQQNPVVILDCAKDVEAARNLNKAINELKLKKLILVVSISSDKNIPEMIAALAPLATQVIITTHRVMERAADPQIIATELKKYNKPFQVILDVGDAVESAIKMAGSDGAVLVSGSVFTVAEARQFWFESSQPKLGLDLNDTVLKK